jgi:hypothetical protein
LALAPETEGGPKHRDRTKEQPKEGHSVKVEGMSRFVGDCPSFDMYLPAQVSHSKPVPFWSVKATHVEADANMELISVAVSVGVSAGMLGDLSGTSAGELLRSHINPESTVKVTLPLYVNHRRLVFGDQLRFYKPASEPEERTRAVIEAPDFLAAFVKNRGRKRPRGKC